MPSLLVDGGFEAGGEAWTFAGSAGVASNNPHSGSKLAYLDQHAEDQAYQTVEIAESGTYTAAAWIATSATGGEFGVRHPGGEMLGKVDLPGQPSYSRYETSVNLEAGDVVEVAFTGGNGWTNLDDVSLIRDTRSILGFEVPGQQGETAIDHEAHTVEFQMPYESNVLNLTPDVTLPAGSTISPDPSNGVNFRKPHRFKVTDAFGNVTWWTAAVRFEKKTITIDSSSSELVDAFNWSKWRANLHVQTGRSGPVNVVGATPPNAEMVDYIPSYWAGYANRTAFYSRDFVHQAEGAHLLGLDEENKSMLKAFASTANESRKWYPLWALNFDGSPYTVDYKSDDFFVREVPAVFELVHEAGQQYAWTGDEDYLNDPVLWQYYEKAVTDFIELHDDHIPNGVAEGTGHGIFDGAASYDERAGFPARIEAADGIASQYRAFTTVAEFAALKGDTALADEFTAKADDLQDYIATDWGVVRGAWPYVTARGPGNVPEIGFSREPNAILAIKEVLPPDDKRTWDYLDFLQDGYQNDVPQNIEGATYIPDALYRYSQDEEAWGWMKYIIGERDKPHVYRAQGSNGDYPEYSYMMISNTVEGIAGVTPDAPNDAVAVRSHLPGEIDWLKLDHVTVGDHDLAVRHEGRTRTSVTHNAGASPLQTTIEFPGAWRQIKVDGRTYPADHSHDNGHAVSSVTVDIPVRKTVNAQAVAPLDPSVFGDTILTHPGDFELEQPSDGATGVAVDTEFTWSASANADEYRIVIARDDAMTDIVAETTVPGPRAVVGGVPAGINLYWEVTAINTQTGQRLVVPAGERTFRTAPSGVPDAPTDLAAYRTGDAVGVTWEPSAQALTSNVSRAPVGSTDFTVVAQGLTGSTWVDSEAAGGPFSYRVTSTNEAGEGAASTVDEQPLPDGAGVVWLSDRRPASATIGWGSIGYDRSVSGGAIAINGTAYEKGIGTHAASEIVYDLDPADARFQAVVGLDDVPGAAGRGSVQFQVVADGEVVLDSGVMRGSPYTEPKTIDLSLLGVERLVLRVLDGGDGNSSDHANWADARVLRLVPND
ncbi:NPCBM/NEW2 domain-containing protein [Jiangella alba]|nr:NPCBM/NEW2 domain-containing protein [Jiangella alba]